MIKATRCQILLDVASLMASSFLSHLALQSQFRSPQHELRSLLEFPWPSLPLQPGSSEKIQGVGGPHSIQRSKGCQHDVNVQRDDIILPLFQFHPISPLAPLCPLHESHLQFLASQNAAPSKPPNGTRCHKERILVQNHLCLLKASILAFTATVIDHMEIYGNVPDSFFGSGQWACPGPLCMDPGRCVCPK